MLKVLKVRASTHEILYRSGRILSCTLLLVCGAARRHIPCFRICYRIWYGMESGEQGEEREQKYLDLGEEVLEKLVIYTSRDANALQPMYKKDYRMVNRVDSAPMFRMVCICLQSPRQRCPYLNIPSLVFVVYETGPDIHRQLGSSDGEKDKCDVMMLTRAPGSGGDEEVMNSRHG